MTIAVDCETDKEQQQEEQHHNHQQHTTVATLACSMQPAKPSICWSVIMPHHCQPTHPGRPACATFSSSLFYVAKSRRQPKGSFVPMYPGPSSFFCYALLNFCL